MHFNDAFKQLVLIMHIYNAILERILMVHIYDAKLQCIVNDVFYDAKSLLTMQKSSKIIIKILYCNNANHRKNATLHDGYKILHRKKLMILHP